ncbi:unnamed protein product, partial [Musa textilis]
MFGVLTTTDLKLKRAEQRDATVKVDFPTPNLFRRCRLLVCASLRSEMSRPRAPPSQSQDLVM